MTTEQYQRPGPCQDHSWSLARRLAQTWRRNPNYRHGRWCRYRRRLEWRLARAAAQPTHYLPRRAWSAAATTIRTARRLSRWLTLLVPRLAAQYGPGQDSPHSPT